MRDRCPCREHRLGAYATGTGRGPVPSSLDGVSLLPLLLGRAEAPQRAFFLLALPALYEPGQPARRSRTRRALETHRELRRRTCGTLRPEHRYSRDHGPRRWRAGVRETPSGTACRMATLRRACRPTDRTPIATQCCIVPSMKTSTCCATVHRPPTPPCKSVCFSGQTDERGSPAQAEGQEEIDATGRESRSALPRDRGLRHFMNTAATQPTPQCPRCRALVDATDRYCRQCGVTLDDRARLARLGGIRHGCSWRFF